MAIDTETLEENKSALGSPLEVIGEKELLPQVLRDNLAIVYGCQSGEKCSTSHMIKTVVETLN